jgi:hypothetical protein
MVTQSWVRCREKTAFEHIADFWHLSYDFLLYHEIAWHLTRSEWFFSITIKKIMVFLI